MAQIDFSTQNYTIGELLEILDIKEPSTREELREAGTTMIENYRIANKPEHVEFFSRATNRLLSNFSEVERHLSQPDSSDEDEEEIDDIREGFNGNGGSVPSGDAAPAPSGDAAPAPSGDATLPGERTFMDEYYPRSEEPGKVVSTFSSIPPRGDNIAVPGPGSVGAQVVQLEESLDVGTAYSQVPYIQGQMNPVLQNVYITRLNVDSQYRQIKPSAQSSSCTLGDSIDQNVEQVGTATDFTFILSEPVTRVLSMSLENLELSLDGYYPFSLAYGTTNFDISFNWRPPSSVPPPPPLTDISAVSIYPPSYQPKPSHYYTVTIPEGSYRLPNSQYAHLTDALNKATRRIVGPPQDDLFFIRFFVGEASSKIQIVLNGKIDWWQQGMLAAGVLPLFEIIWYTDTNPDTRTVCATGSAGMKGGMKINSNLGWSLGIHKDKSQYQPTISDASGTPSGSLGFHPINGILSADTLIFASIPNVITGWHTLSPPCPPASGACTWDVVTCGCRWFWWGIQGGIIVNAKGTDYMVLVVDDFNSNRYNDNMPGLPLPTDREEIKMPSYATRAQASRAVCVTNPALLIPGNDTGTGPGRIAFVDSRFGPHEITRQCRKGTPNPNPIIDGSSNLTNAQKYTAEQILNRKVAYKENLNIVPIVSDVLYRFPVTWQNEGSAGRLSIKVAYLTSSGGRGIGRRYFGPVTINRLAIKLLDDKGQPIELNGGELSLTLILERQYQF